MTDLFARARNYVATLPSAVSGEHGHDAAFRVAAVLVHGFALSEADAFPVMEEYNARCVPPWSQKELEHKLRSAAEWAKYDTPRGHLAGASWREKAVQLAPRPKKSISFSWFKPDEPVRIEPSPVASSEIITDGDVASDDPEARRIAGELAKLHHAGAIKTEGDASFYANLVRDFGATYAPQSAAALPSRGPRSAPALRHVSARADCVLQGGLGPSVRRGIHRPRLSASGPSCPDRNVSPLHVDDLQPSARTYR